MNYVAALFCFFKGHDEKRVGHDNQPAGYLCAPGGKPYNRVCKVCGRERLTRKRTPRKGTT